MVKLKKVGLGKDVVVDENPFSRWLFTKTSSVWIC